MTTPQLPTYRHSIPVEGADVTVCGISADEHPDTDIACECGIQGCKFPVTCPICIAIKHGKES